MTLTIEEVYARFDTVYSIKYKYLKSVIENGTMHSPVPFESPRGIVRFLRYDIEHFTDLRKPLLVDGLNG